MAKTSYNQTVRGNKQNAAAFERQAELLQQLIKARRQGRKNLKGQYDNALDRNRATRQSVVGDLLNGFNTAAAGYDRSAADADANLGTAASDSVLNRAREGASAMAELSSMQAGETDRIKAMGASLRNMRANLEGGTSDYASAMTGINNSLGDLNSSVTANVNNALREENASNASAFQEYSAGQQQAYADLVDLFGEQGSAHEQAADAYADKNSKTKSRGTKNITVTQTDKSRYGKDGNAALDQAELAFDKSGNAADRLAELQGNMFTDPIMTIDQMNVGIGPSFTPASLKANRSNLDDLANAGTLRKLASAQGSTLRKAVS